MGGIKDRRQRQQDAIDAGEPLRTKKGRKKKGNEKGFRPNSARHIGEKVGKALLDPSNSIRRGARRAGATAFARARRRLRSARSRTARHLHTKVPGRGLLGS